MGHGFGLLSEWTGFLTSILYFPGLSTSHFAWAFHSVAEEELLATLPPMQKGDPTWAELRAMGAGWWVRNANSLRTCIEKVSFLDLFAVNLDRFYFRKNTKKAVLHTILAFEVRICFNFEMNYFSKNFLICRACSFF